MSEYITQGWTIDTNSVSDVHPYAVCPQGHAYFYFRYLDRDHCFKCQARVPEFIIIWVSALHRTQRVRKYV